MSTQNSAPIAAELIKKALSGGRFSHAYIFSGPPGVGKTAMARFTAKSLLCENFAPNGPCGTCFSCRAAETDNHPDIIVLKPDKKRTISADYVRSSLVNDASLKPYRSRYKVYIIEKADMMQVPSQNALLKTLEEPPPHGIFLLCAENIGLLLPTVMSRCVNIKLRPMPIEMAAARLLEERPLLSPEEARFYAAIAGGGLGGAMELSKPDGGENTGAAKTLAVREAVLTLLENIGAAEPHEILMRVKPLEVYKDDAGFILDIAEAWYRDIAVIGSGANLLLADVKPRIQAEAYRLNEKNILEMVGYVEDARYKLSCNTNFLLTMEVMALRLAGCVANKGAEYADSGN